MQPEGWCRVGAPTRRARRRGRRRGARACTPSWRRSRRLPLARSCSLTSPLRNPPGAALARAHAAHDAYVGGQVGPGVPLTARPSSALVGGAAWQAPEWLARESDAPAARGGAGRAGGAGGAPGDEQAVELAGAAAAAAAGAAAAAAQARAATAGPAPRRRSRSSGGAGRGQEASAALSVSRGDGHLRPEGGAGNGCGAGSALDAG